MANIEIPLTSTQTIDALVASDKFLDKDKTFIANCVLVTDNNGKTSTTSTPASKVGFLNNVASDIQDQLNTKATSASPVFTGNILAGSSNHDEYPNSRLTAFTGSSGYAYDGNIGVTGDASSGSFITSCGVCGSAKAYEANKARGVVGVGMVAVTSHTGESIGVEAMATDAHIGGNNIAFQADATGGLVNYSFEGKNGLMLNREAITSGDGTNNCTIDSDTGLKFNGTTTNFIDLAPFQLYAGIGGTASAITAYNGNMEAYTFPPDVVRKLHCNFQMPHGYKEGSDIVIHLHLYIPTDAAGGDIKFGVEYTWANIDNSTPTNPLTTTTIYVKQTIAANAGTYNNFILPFPTVDGDEKSISSVLMCRLFRDGNDAEDTFPASVWLKSADVHVEVDTIGSREPMAK